MKKKVIAILLSLSMIVGIMPTLAFATSGETTPVTETTAPTESTPAVCSVCQTENCTAEHKQCEICKAYDCAKAHMFCETCQKYDCGVDHNVEPVSEPELCTTCGKKDCSGQHENWCETCKKDNCGIDHSAPKTCETCGEALSEGHTCPTDPVCICSVLCKADAPKNDCPVCCAEGGVCTGSDKYVTVQAMIDALRTEFKESEREAALAEYEAATKAISELSEEEFALLDLTNYYAAANPTVIPEASMVCKIGNVQFDSLSAAISAANATEGGATIELTDDITLSGKLTITGNVTISGEHTMTRADTYTGNLFTVNKDASLTLTGGLVIDGGNDWTFLKEKYFEDLDKGKAVSNGTVSYTSYESNAPVANDTMIIANGDVTLHSATIQNNAGSGVFSIKSGATLSLTNAIIQKITKSGSSCFADVDSGCKVIINSGTEIRYCHNHGGNGTLSYMRGKSIMNGGKIHHNSGVDNNGSVFMLYGSGASFIMEDGEIYNNHALKGTYNGWNPVFYVYGNGTTFVMNGGSIHSNSSTTVGAIGNNGDNSTVNLNGGSISNNSSTSGLFGDDLYLYCDGTIGKDMTVGDVRSYGDLTVNGGVTGNAYLYGGSTTISSTGSITGDVTLKNGTTLNNSGTITGNITMYIPAGDKPNNYYTNNGTHEGELIVYYTVTAEYPYVLNLYYGGGVDQFGLNGSGHLKWGADGAETKNVTLADITNAVTVTKYGYTFAGWYYDEALTEKVTDPITLTAKTAEYLYAAWEKTKAEINYTAVTQNYGKQAAVSTSGGTVSGSETVDATVAAVNGSTITVNEGYTFAGWFTDEACTQKVTASWVGTDNKLTPQKNNEGLYESGSYYALFEEMTTTVTYKVVDTGTGSVYFEEASAAETITDTFGKVTGSPKTATAKPVNGYMFVGWYTDEACTMLHSKQAAMNSSENGTFYAKFIKDHATVTIEKTVDKASSSDQSFILNISGTTYNNDPVNVDVVIVISAGQTSGCVKVVLPVSNGDYSISDQDGWNWRYKVKDNATITINGGDPDSVLDVTSTLENGKWFADSYIYPYKKES